MRYEESSSEESYKKCKKPKPLRLVGDETAPDTLINFTDLTSLTQGAVRKFNTQVIYNLRDKRGNVRGSVEQVRTTSIYPAKPDTLYNLVTGDVSLIVKGKEEEYSVVNKLDVPFPLPQVPTRVGVFKLNSVKGKATYSKVEISYQGIGDLQRVFFTFF